MKREELKYVVVTPARNEQDFIELTIRSMIAQTIKPLRWVIVSDGSTDKTDEIASSYARQHPWIDFIRRPERVERDFAGKVGCFNAGYERVKNLDFDLVASLDADLSFPPDYFPFLVDRFSEDPKLGLAGTPFSEGGATYNYTFSSVDHVSGACQFFRRSCFEAIGGYVPVKGGGIDDIAVLSSRVKGWKTRTFIERTCIHHRPMGSANYKGKLRTSFKMGQRAYCLGYHPLWQIFRSAYQMSRPPYVSGGCALSAGYFWSMLTGTPRQIGRELIEFQQREQMRRLRTFLSKMGRR